jgi:sugar lactone lactonase YvrE
VASRDTNEVRRYDGVTGALIDTFVSKGSGGLSGPTSLDFGPDDGHLYVSSGNANEVLRYDGATGVFIDIFVGDDPTTPTINEAGSLQVPRGIVFGPDGNADGISDLYVSSRDSDEVLLYDGTRGTVLRAFVTDIPQTPFNENGGLNHPTGLTFGPDNNLYVNSFDNHQVLQYDAAGTFLSIFVANDPATPDVDESGGLFEPVGITFGPGSTLYVSSFSNNEILSYDAAGTFIGRFVSDDPATLGVDETGGLRLAAELIFDAAGNCLVSSFGSNRILSYNGTTGAFQSVFAPQNSVALDEPAMPTGLAISPIDNFLYVASPGTNRVLRYDAETGAFIGVFVADDLTTPMVDESGGLLTPAALAFDALGNLYVSSFQNNRVLRYDPTGLFLNNFVADDPATPTVDESGGLAGPIGVAFDATGNLYVSSRTTGNVLRYDANGVFLGPLVANGTLAAPTELVFAPGGANLYVSESGANAIRRFDGTGVLIDTIVADDPTTVGIDETGGLLTPRGLVVSTDGSSLLVNSSDSDQVLRYDSATGLFLEVFLSNDTLPEAVGILARPVGLLVAPPPPAPQ